MTQPNHLTTEAGAPVADNPHSQTAGPTGPRSPAPMNTDTLDPQTLALAQKA
jgi:catalase